MLKPWYPFGGWHFDVPTVIITLLAVPLLTYLLGILRKHGKEWGGYILEGLCYWVGRLLIHSLAARFSLRRYCRLQLQKENKFLYVPSRTDIKLEIDKVFVNLTLEEQGERTVNYDQSTVFAAGNRLRIIGDPGSGKSSLVKRLFRDACQLGMDKPAKAKLPVLIELKNVVVPKNLSAQNMGTWFYGLLEKSAEKSEVYGMKDCFRNYARVCGLLVLLDGLDEVATSAYERVQAAVIALSDTLANMSPENRVVLTMRTQLHDQVKESFRETFGRALFIKPFTPADVYEFLSRWPFANGRLVSRIYSELTDRPTLREMCTNPLVLAMYVAERQAGDEPLTPESRTDFYRKVIDELLIKRRSRQTGVVAAAGKLREQRERILGRLAYEHLLDWAQSANSLRWSDAIRVVKEVVRCSPDEAEHLFLQISKDTGLISQERERESFRFIHLTFCEFLAAREAVDGQVDGLEQLISVHRNLLNKPKKRYGSSRLLEVIPFACGLLPRLKRDDAITKVGALGDERLLARCFLETKNYDHLLWKAFIDKTRSSLLKAGEAEWSETWLQELHLFNIVVRDAALCSVHLPASDERIDLGDFYRELLAKQGGEGLAKLLAAYASHDAPAALRLAEVSGLDLASNFPQVVIDNCSQMPFLSLIIDRALADHSGRGVAWALPLAEAALKSRLVAKSLHGKAADHGTLSEAVRVVAKSRRWDVSVFAKCSFYTQLLTLAVDTVDSSTPHYPRLLILKGVRAPGALNTMWKFFTWLMATGAVGGAVIGLASLLVQKADLSRFTSFMAQVPSLRQAAPLALLITPLFYYLMFRYMALQMFYRNLMDLNIQISSSQRLIYWKTARVFLWPYVLMPRLLSRSERRSLQEIRDLNAHQGTDLGIFYVTDE